jgi:type I restriction enzyme S subunit
MRELLPLAKALNDAQVFTDGDWVESKDQDPQGDVRLTQLADVGDGCWIDKSERYLTSRRAAELRCTFLKPGDVLVARMPDPLGRCCIFPGDAMPCVTVVDVCVIRPNPSRIDSRFLMHAINSPVGRNGIARHVTGTTRQRISRSNLGKVELPFPPLPEQKRIAAILDAADALRARRRESIEQLDSLIQATFLEMFGDPVTNPKGWAQSPLGNIMRIRRGGSPRPIDRYLGGTINWVKISDATASDDDIYITQCAERITEEGLAKTTLLEPGSFIFANSGVSLGFARILKVRGAIHDGWLAFDQFSDDVLQPLFFLKALNGITSHFRQIAPSGTQPNLNTGLMKAFQMILPPLVLQTRFASIVESIEQQKARLKAHLAELDTLFASLQSRAFNGELVA